VFEMALMRGFAKVDDDGKVRIPDNIRLAVELQPGQLVELKVTGPDRAKTILLSKRKDYR